MRRLWIVLYVLAFQAQGADDLVTVYQLALENDPSFRAAQASLRAGLEEEIKGRAELLPKVNVNAGFGLNQSQNRGQFPAGGILFPSNTDIGSESKSWGVSLTQPVFDLSAWFRFKRGQELTEQAKARFAAESQALILKVAESYLAVLKAQANLNASRAQERATERQLAQVKARFEVGLLAITDLREAEAAFDLAVAARLADEGALQVAKEQLSILTGRSHEALLALKDDYPIAPPDPKEVEKWIEFARQNNYDLKVAALAREVALQTARVASAEHLPKITANLSYSETRSENDFHNLTPAAGGSRDFNFPRNVNQGALSLNLNLPLFAGGAIGAARRQALAEYAKSEEELLGAVRTTVQNTRAEYINVMTAIARSQATHKAVLSNRASLKASQAGYEVGTRTLVDVLAALRALYLAVRDHQNARLDYVLASLRLKRLAGTLSPQDLIELNRHLTLPKDETALTLE
ncbi:efflux transporter outer membrane subunit OpmH [Methylothermus subterraneus]